MPGGNTPKNFFHILSSVDIDWRKVTLLLSDERMVPLSNSASNYGMIKTFLLENLPDNNRPIIIPQMEKFDGQNNEEFYKGN